MNLLTQIEYHRSVMMCSMFYSDAFYHHGKLAAKFTRQWRESNSLRAAK